jgi:hypothetical protein
MPTTPNRGWAYPSLEQNPYFETIEDFFLAQDADMHATITGVRTVATGGTGASTLTSGAYLKGAGTSAITTVTPPIPVSDGGMGALSFTSGALLLGNSTGAIQAGTRAPYRGATLSDSATVLNTIAYTSFSKSIPLPAGILNVAGAVLQIKIRVVGVSNIAAPGTMALDVALGSKRLGYASVALPASSSTYEASMTVGGQTRATGASGTFGAGPGFLGLGQAGVVAISDFVGGAFESFNLTAVLVVSLSVQFSVADPNVSATLRLLNVEVTYPDTTVS